MPLIKVQSSVAAPEKAKIENLLKTLSAKVAKHFGKPESYVMTIFESDIPMTFGGSFDPVCYVEIKNIGTMSSSQTKAMSADFCEEIEAKLGVPANRIYLEFNDAQRHLWGWNKSTFG
ncbi:MAG TPA: phenylpyruvate tautomerase MIF-related protein [Xenococcaceae cyanobacterium]|jgi:phenylpyruvate tautomerase PptA (4-oxalocrotonate tautomerase family)